MESSRFDIDGGQEPNGLFRPVYLKGSTFSYVFTWRDENNQLVNLTGYTGLLQVWDKPGVGVPAIEFNTADGTMILGGSAGTMRLWHNAVKTSQFALSIPSASVAKPRPIRKMFYSFMLYPGGVVADGFEIMHGIFGVAE
jgi:hypothetical protein